MGINIRHPQTETLQILSHKLCCGKGGDVIQTSISIVLLSFREKQWLCLLFFSSRCVQSLVLGEEGICSVAVALVHGF